MQNDAEALMEYPIFHMSLGKTALLTVSLRVNDAEQVDTGAVLSLICEATYHSLSSLRTAPDLRPVRVQLQTYSGEELKVCGKVTVQVIYEQQCFSLDLFVVEGNGTSLLGRDWLEKI